MTARRPFLKKVTKTGGFSRHDLTSFVKCDFGGLFYYKEKLIVEEGIFSQSGINGENWVKANSMVMFAHLLGRHSFSSQLFMG